jgi:Kef-type K+ transport system membrane component KefB/Trk K+ transport system NAD-binding subunit
VEHNPFVALLLITGLALIVPILASRVRRISLPIVVGEIVAGIIIGRSGLNLIQGSPTLDFLAEFGFTYLMFLSGLEVDFDLLIPASRRQAFNPRRPLPMAILIFLGTLALALGASLLLGKMGLVGSPLLMGLILSTTSLGVVVPVLKERKLTSTDFGQAMLVAASVADFATLLLLTLVIAIRSEGLTLDLLLIPVLLVAFILAVRLVQRYGRALILQRILREVSSATAQIRIRGAFALMVAWVVLAEALGVEVILGAFLAGAVAGLVADVDDDAATEKLDAIGYGFFIPIFFIMVGVDFNLSALFESPQAMLLVPLLAAIAYLVKLVPGLLLRLRFSWRETFAGGMLLASRLSLIIAAASIALSLGLINDAINAAVILLAVISVTLSPLAFSRLHPEPDESRRTGVIIAGQDQLVEYLAERLIPSGETIHILCPDVSHMDAFERLPVEVVSGCSDLAAALETAGASGARALIDLTSNDQETLEVCRLAREQFRIPIVISRVSEVELIPQLQAIGVRVVQPALATAMALEGALRYPGLFDVLVSQEADELDVTEVRLANTAIAGLQLRQVRLPGDALILSLQRAGGVVVPHGETGLELDDVLGLIGSPAALEAARDLLRG